MALSVTYASTVSGANYTVPPNTTNLAGKKGAATKITQTSTLNGTDISRIPESFINAFGSTVVSNSNVSSSAEADFAILNSEPISAKITTNLGGRDVNAIYNGSNYYELEQSINKIQKVYTRRISTAIRNGQFSLLTGKFDSGYPSLSEDTFATDYAATINRSVPGSLRVNSGSSVSTKYNYSKKTG